ncbi:Ecdysone-induced protein 74EF [Echinococcus granulosus]|uniref:Ecdysone-induced protein 74EF n=1 Tax=Echinococcus granulosus TaxID=6210 RepID=W6UJ33_ECHGR|nr:Ecdysone-induced protein 74EF [Echinococcus granulosus]EUB61470.1 Ecdysone-induced protein 74EF [Echinococcus granulosus]
MNFRCSLPLFGSLPHFASEANMDPVLTDAISGEDVGTLEARMTTLIRPNLKTLTTGDQLCHLLMTTIKKTFQIDLSTHPLTHSTLAHTISAGGYLMDATKQEEDEGTGLFDLQSQPQTWNVCLLQSSNTPIAGAITPISASFPDSRLSRLSSSEFQDNEGLQAAFGDLNTSEDVVPCQYGFNKPPDRAPTQLGGFEEESGFDSGFGSLQLTPSEIQSEGMCANTSPQSPPLWRRSTLEEFRRLSNEVPMAKEEEPHISNFDDHVASRQLLEYKRCQAMLEYRPKFSGECLNIFANTSSKASTSKDVQDRLHWNGIRSSSQGCRHLGKSGQNALLSQIPLTKPYSAISTTTPVAISSSSSSSSFAFEATRSTASPVSHRNFNKRVAQQEASEFLSCSEGGNLDESFDDIDAFGFDADLDDPAFQLASECLPPPQPLTRKVLRDCQSCSLRHNQNSSISGTIHRRSRNTVLTNSPIDRPRKTCAPRNGGRKRNLLNFILELLTTRQTCVEWVDKPKQVFQIVNPDQLTRLWGEHKNNIKMSFDSLSRSLRLYYKPGKLERIPGTRHQYRLIQRPPESPGPLRETSSHRCNSEHRRCGTPVNYPTALKQHPPSQKPYL